MNYESLPKITRVGGMLFILHDCPSDPSRAMRENDFLFVCLLACLMRHFSFCNKNSPLCSHFTTYIQARVKLQFDEEDAYRATFTLKITFPLWNSLSVIEINKTLHPYHLAFLNIFDSCVYSFTCDSQISIFSM